VTTPEARKRNVRLTVFALLGVIMLIVGMFVRQFVSPDRLDPEWLKAHNAVLFEPPRSFEPPRLIDQDAQAFDGAAFQGNWSVLFFGFTNCPDVCPTTLTLLRDVAAALPAGKYPVRFYLVTVDPARDTPAVLKPYIAHFSPEFTALTGEFLDVHRFATQMNIPFRKSVEADGNYTIDHSANLALINPQGHFAGFLMPPFDKERVLQVLQVLGRRDH
jgi:protein SCO1/2